MTARPERRAGRLGIWSAVPVVAFLLVAPVGLLLVPLAALGVARSIRTREVTVLGAVAVGAAAWWLWPVSPPPDQIVRAVAVIGAATFTAFGGPGSNPITPRVLLSTVVTALGGALLVGLAGIWPATAWWIESRVALVQVQLLQLAQVATPRTDIIPMVEVIPDVLVGLFPAIIALQMMAGLVLAASIGVGTGLAGPEDAPGALAEFRFSEHLGWLAVLALGMLILGVPAGAGWWAGNVLVVMGALYALRGAAVWWFLLRSRRRPGCLMAALLVVAGVFLWQAVLAAIIVLGVVDSGFDLRTRWTRSRST